VQTVLLKEGKASPSELKRRFVPLERKILTDAQREGLKKEQLLFKAELDVRYQGQSYELRVEAGPQLRRRFEKVHERHYGYVHARRPIEVVNRRLHDRDRSGLRPPPPPQNGCRGKKASPVARARIYWRGKHGTAAVYRREELRSGMKLRGPLVLVEYSATTWV